MPQSGDILSQLLQGTESYDPDPTAFAADRAAREGAILQHIRAQVQGGMNVQDPVATPAPAYGPIDKLGQVLGLESKFKPVSPGLSDQMWAGGQVAKNERDSQRMDKLQSIQQFGTQFGTDPARKLAGTLGEPEIGAELPSGVKGIGELREQDRINKIQAMQNSLDIQTQRIGMQEANSAIRDYVSQGRLDLANQLASYTKERMTDAETKQKNAPLDKMYNDLNESLNRRLQSIDQQLANTTEGSVQEQRLLDQRDKLEKRQRKMLEKAGTYKTPQELGKDYYEEEPPAKAGSSSYRPLPALSEH